MLNISEHDLEAVFRLAYGLHPDETWEIPAGIIFGAIDWVATLKKTQERRLETDAPYKQKLPELALLQLGVFRASHDWECDQESVRPTREPRYFPTADDLLLRYLKFLVWKTCDRNSCHVAVGLGCYLYRYRPGEISSLAPDCFEEDNIRRVKVRLGRWITKRFQQDTCFPIIGQRPPTHLERELLRKAMILFAPWGAQHLSPQQSVLTTYFGYNSPRLEWERIHALIDLACAGLPHLVGEHNHHLTKGSTMRLDDPDQKLEIPDFYKAAAPSCPNNRFDPGALSSRELALLRQSVQYRLDKNHQRRKSFQLGSLRVCAEEEEIAHFAPRGANPQRTLTIPANASYLEIFGQAEDGEELLLAVFPLLTAGAKTPSHQHFWVALENGEQLELLVHAPPPNNGETMDHLVELRCAPSLRALEIVNTVSLILPQEKHLDSQSLRPMEKNNWQEQGWRERLALVRKSLWPTTTAPRLIIVAALLGMGSFLLPVLYRTMTRPPASTSETKALPTHPTTPVQPSLGPASQSTSQLKLTSFSEGVKPPVSDWGVYLPGRASLREAVVTDAAPERDKVMRLAFEVSSAQEYAVFYLKFRLSNFRPEEWPIISVWLRSERATKIKLELKLREAKWGWKMHYLQVGEKWQQHRLRLSDFQTLSSDGWKATNEFVLAFDQQLTTPNGVIYLDDIAFEKE